MLLNTTNKAYPAFISENYLNSFAIGAPVAPLSASSGEDFVHRVADMEPKSIWSSIGSDDTTQEVISSGFFLEGSQLAVDIDFIAILNHNLKDFTLELRNNSVVLSTAVFAGVTDNFTIISTAGLIGANNFRLLMDTTQTVDAEKQVGVLAFGAAILQSSLPFARGGFLPRTRQNTKSAQMGNGSIRFAHVYRADAGFIFDGWSVEFGAIPEAESQEDFREKLLCEPNPFMFWPHPGDQPGLLRQARITPNTYSDPYESGTNRLAGRHISFGIDDVGAG